jgi:hypothetical protein
MTAPVYVVQHVGELSVDGLGWVWQCNFFGHYALVCFLLPPQCTPCNPASYTVPRPPTSALLSILPPLRTRNLDVVPRGLV